MTIAHIDADLIVYSVGNACDGRYYPYKGERYETKKQLLRVLKDDGVEDADIQVKRDPESWEKCKTSLFKYLEGIIEKVGSCDYKVYISGKGNFRHQIATILPYKANRSSTERPYHYDNIRQFLVDVYDAEISQGEEADDLIGKRHNPEDDIIVSLDKDLDVIPGVHFNWKKDTCYYVSEVEANRNFFKQILTGDSTDNILGLFGVGEKSKLVTKIDSMEDVSEMQEHVLKCYRDRFGSYAEQFFQENVNLLWIGQQREKPIEF